MGPFNFLLVDDEREFVETVARRLRRRGFSVACAVSGTQALQRLEQDDAIDVVVLDIAMPEPDGLKTLHTLKKRHPLIEVIMLTGHADVNWAVGALKSGAFDYLTKPFDLNHLISKAGQAANRKKAREAKIRAVRMKPYISKRDRDQLIARILDNKEKAINE